MLTWFVLGALAIVALGGVPGLFGRDRWTTWLIATGCVTLCALSLAVLAGATAPTVAASWGLPIGGFSVALDPLGAAFLLPIALVGGLVVVYGDRYWSRAEHPDSAARVSLLLGVCIAALGMVVIARDGILFLVAWEIMALTCFFLVTADDRQPATRSAGWLYLVATHLATLLLIALFAVVHGQTGSFAIAPLPDTLDPAARGAMFFLALAAFGLKAGLMPLHVWLPSAHAAAPSHVSALMSGVMLKIGIYGLVRFFGLIPSPPEVWGWLVLLLGLVSAVAGVLLALGQHDLKRLLAYHSIENIGIIVIGLGLALLGRALGEPLWVALGLGGALLHTWNHGIFKSLLFFAAGAVHHATGTRTIDRLGGLARRMPWTAGLFILGALAICGLPPLNGFISELLLYLGLLDAGTGGQLSVAGAPASALVVPGLALVGALAVACFVKVVGIAFLGEPRSSDAAEAHEAHSSMLGAMGALAVLCVFIGVFPIAVAPLIDQAVAAWPSSAPAPALNHAAPLATMTALGLALAVVLAGAVALMRLRVPKVTRETTAIGTWDCGYVAPDATMQYTGSSFAHGLVRVFGWVLRPRTHRPSIIGPLPRASTFHTHVPEPVLERVVYPVLDKGRRLLSRARVIQQGRVQSYILYVLIGLFALFLWHLLPLANLFADLGARGAFP